MSACKKRSVPSIHYNEREKQVTLKGTDVTDLRREKLVPVEALFTVFALLKKK